MSAPEFTFAPRPLRSGTKGTECRAVTNCFRLSKVSAETKLAFHHYQGIFVIANDREIKNTVRRQEIVKKLYIRDRPQFFQPGQVVYDGKAGLFTSKELGADRDLVFELFQSGSDAPSDSNSNSTGANIRVKLQKVGYIPSSEFDDVFLRRHDEQSRRRNQNKPTTAQQILNLLLINATPDDFRRVATRTTMYSSAQKRQLEGRIELWRGCFAHVRISKEHLLLNVDVSTAVMYASDALPNVAMNLLGLTNAREVANPDCFHLLESRLNHVRVRQIVAGKLGRIRTIRKLVQRAGHERFYTRDGTEMTVREYFLYTHNYRMRYPDLPGIMVMKKDKDGERTEAFDVIPFELLEIIEGQFYRRRLDSMMQKEFQRLSTIEPEQRKVTIAQHLKAFVPDVLKLSGLHLDHNFVRIPGRKLPPPFIRFGNKVTVTPERGEWRMTRRLSFFKPCFITSWAVLCYEQSADMQFCADLLRRLGQLMACFGINTEKVIRQRIIRKENPQGDMGQHLSGFVSDVEKTIKDTFTLERKKGHLLIVVLPGKGKSPLYEQIKRLCDTTAGPGRVTQLLSWNAARNLSDSYLTNVILKINEKLGGSNFIPVGSGLQVLQETSYREATIVIGLDASHPGPGVMRPSMASLVYAVDIYATKYFATCSLQPPRTEVIQDLKGLMTLAFMGFAEHQKMRFLPSRILVYRDGLSDGELNTICTEEINAIKAAIERVWRIAPDSTFKLAAEEVKITYIVVGKRHHIRFIAEANYGDIKRNCPSGFITDSAAIASLHVYDFFLQSHAGRLGTSRPAHYIVVKDDSKFSADELQTATFGLSHAYARSTCAVSIPAPVYYAHLVCKRANIHIQFVGDGSAPSLDGSSEREFNKKDWKMFGINPMHKELKYFI